MVALSGIAVLLVWGVPYSPVAALFIVSYVLVCPGWAIARCFRFKPFWLEITLSISLSITMALLASTAALYAGLWIPQVLFGLLVLITLIAVSIESVLYWSDSPGRPTSVEPSRQ